jgi:hypothetical protein
VTNPTGFRLLALALALVVVAGCASPTAKGAIVGAGSGAFVGAATSGRHAGQNAVLGAIIGGLLGALVGETVAHRQTAAAAAPAPPPPPPPSAGAPPPPPGQWTVVTAPPPPPAGMPGPPQDPTRGVVTNGTPWEIHVFVDVPPGTPGPLVLRRGDSAPMTLDIGQHRIVAQAFVDTSLGRRIVGTFDQILTVDPRAPGWTIHFFPANF